MTSETAKRNGVPKIVVFDTDSHGERQIAETVDGAGLDVEYVTSLDVMVEKLKTGDFPVGIFAYEATWPSPQRVLRKIREVTQGVRLIVVHAANSPRLRLGQRLWSIGLFDYFVSRTMPPHELRPILKQAYADAMIERATIDAAKNEATGPSIRLPRHLQFLQGLQSAFINQSRIEGVIRELHMKLPQFVDYALMEVLVTTQERVKLFVFQSRPVEHEYVWKLAEEICKVSDPYANTPLKPEMLQFETMAPTSPSDGDEEFAPLTKETTLMFPMLLCGELVGCLALWLNDPSLLEPEDHAALQLTANILGTSLHNAQVIEHAERTSLVDELTAVHNRRYLGRVLEAEWQRTTRYGLQLSIAMLDIDDFKRINDLHGHLVGDTVLRCLASLLRQQLRETDHIVRYGGEEFLILLPETGASKATLALERMRMFLSRQPIYTAKTGNLRVSFSAGIASYPTCKVATPAELIELADHALLWAKRSGKDRVCLASSEGFTDLGSESLYRPDEGNEKRKHLRIKSQLKVRYIELPEFATQVVDMDSVDVSAGGISIKGPGQHLKKNSYALVYLQDGEAPVLSQVMWTRDDGAPEGERAAGLRFVNASDINLIEKAPKEVVEHPKALVITERPAMRALIERVLKAAQYEAVILDGSQVFEADSLQQYQLVVLGESSLRERIGQSLPDLRKRLKPAVRIVVINETSDKRQALETIQSHHVEHLVSTDSASEEILFATLNKLLLGQYFGIKKYLLWGADPKSWMIRSSEEKVKVISGIREIARQVNCHPRILDLLVGAVDEMIINALYRPLESGGREGHPVTIECGSDGRLLAVAVIDEHGLFKDEDMFRGLGQALIHEQQGIPQEAKHANLGFRIMLSALTQLAINVDPGKRTEIIGIVDLRKSLRDYRQAVPSVGLFTKSEAKVF